MNEVQQQVRVATRRLTVQQFLAILPWTLTASLVIAAIGVLIPKLVPLAVIQPVWDWAWMGGAFLAGILLATLITYLRRRSGLQAAMEIDNRFGLKERVASCLALSPQEQETQAGQALMADAMRRVSQLDVSDAFRVQPSRWSWLPACCALLTFGLTLLTDAKPDTPPQAQASVVETKKQVQNSADSLKKRLEERRKEAMEKGLQEAGEVLNKLEQGVDSLAKKSDVDRQKAFVKLNDLAKEVQEKQKQLGDREQIQKQLNSLKDIQQGPADRMAKAIKDGDFKTAISQLKQMKDSLDKGQLSDEEKEKLAQQFAEMKEKLQQLAQSHENAKQEMQKQIDQKIAQGDREAAANLQQKLDKMTQQDRQMNQLEKIAQKLGQCCASMKSGSQSKDGQPGKNGQQGQQGQQSQQANQGQPGQQGQQAKQGQKSEQGQQGENAEASDQLGQLADSLEQMQQEMDQMEMLDDAMSQISQAKQSMNCSKCNGMGCSLCNGQSTASSDAGGKSRGQGKQNGLGEGQGSGARPESESDSDFYDSQVRTQIGRGRSVVAGSTPGPNRAGQAIEEVKSELEAGQRSQDDPLTGQRLPKPQRQLTREYFDAFREGE